MAEARNCRRCGKIFQYAGGMPLCGECIKKDEDDFNAVREYLYENPKATLLQIAEALEIPIEKIMRYLRDGRLETTGTSGLTLQCEKCGKTINSGRFCASCKDSLQDSLKAIAGTIKDTSESESLKNDTDDREGRYYNRKLEILAKKNIEKKD